jgi:hypothetical protein
MSIKDICTSLCLIYQQEDAFRNIYFNIMSSMSPAEYFLLQNMRRSSDEMVRVRDFYDITIPFYTLGDFKSHFRLSRSVTTCLKLSTTAVYNNLKGPTPYLGKDVVHR